MLKHFFRVIVIISDLCNSCSIFIPVRICVVSSKGTYYEKSTFLAIKCNLLFLRIYPSYFVNTVIDDTTKEIIYRDYIDISVAVATPKV